MDVEKGNIFAATIWISVLCVCHEYAHTIYSAVQLTLHLWGWYVYDTYDGVSRVSGLHREPAVWTTPHRSTHPTEKQDYHPLVTDSDLHVANSVRHCGCSVQIGRVEVSNERVGVCNERVRVCNERVGVCNDRVVSCFALGCAARCGVLRGDCRFPT